MGRNERSKDIYKLIPQENGPVFPEITITVKSFFTRKYLIQDSNKKIVWTYKKSGKWYEFFSNYVLETNNGIYEVVVSDEKFQIHREGKWIGTIKKVYDGIFDKGEYDVSFDSEKNLTAFLILASILVLETEVQRGGD